MVTKQTGVLVFTPTSSNRAGFSAGGLLYPYLLLWKSVTRIVLFLLLFLLAIKLALGLFIIQALLITPQTDWVLYGQASRAISTR